MNDAPSNLEELFWRLVWPHIRDNPWMVASVAVAVVVFLAWWNFPKIRDLPGMRSILDWLLMREVPKADPSKFTVAVARFDLDPDNELQRLVVETLSEYPGIECLIVDMRIKFSSQRPQRDVRRGHERARDILRGSGAEVLVWGTAIRQDGHLVPKLFMTQTAREQWNPQPERYQLNEELALPQTFWRHLLLILALATNALSFEHRGKNRTFPTDALGELAGRVKTLLEQNDPQFMHTDAERLLRELYASCHLALFDREGGKRHLDEAKSSYEVLLSEAVRKEAPLMWARAQNDYGLTLLRLGQRGPEPKILFTAIQAFEHALSIFTRNRYPVDWARAHHNIGTTYKSMYLLKDGGANLELGIEATKKALEVLTFESAPELWAIATNSLGIGHVMRFELNQSDESIEEVHEAIRLYDQVLDRFDSSDARAIIVQTLNNKGNALGFLGRMTQEASWFEKALQCYEISLENIEKDKAVEEWAGIKNNQATSLLQLGLPRRDSDPTVLSVTEPDDVEAKVQVLQESGLVQNSQQLRQAAAAFRDALDVFTEERHRSAWANAKRGLGDALCFIGSLKETPDVFCEGLEQLLDSWEAARSHVPFLASRFEVSIDRALGLGAVAFPGDDTQKCFSSLRLQLSRFREQRTTEPPRLT